jgi:hypothetical protein
MTRSTRREPRTRSGSRQRSQSGGERGPHPSCGEQGPRRVQRPGRRAAQVRSGGEHRRDLLPGGQVVAVAEGEDTGRLSRGREATAELQRGPLDSVDGLGVWQQLQAAHRSGTHYRPFAPPPAIVEALR